MSWTDRKAEYEAIVRQIDPSVRLTTKDGWFWKILAVLVSPFVGYRGFLDHYATTIGPVQAYPSSWETLSPALLVHEARHTRQCRWFGLGIHPWVGLPLYGLAYLLLPLPLGLALVRWWAELDAERASYRESLRRGEPASAIRERAARFGRTVCGASYGWALLGGARTFERAAEAEIQEGRGD
jgi:hypothetical protein